ncbi:MAG: hypothetical protein KAW56_09075 [Candidatus Marinimicrobia bacterium]|nr:hypothetical protein [Candidatus Neomarinimicrobiota bacterium]
MVNSMEEEIFRRIDILQKQFCELKEKTEKNLDNSAMLYRLITKVEKKLIHMSVIAKKIIDQVNKVLKILDKKN